MNQPRLNNDQHSTAAKPCAPAPSLAEQQADFLNAMAQLPTAVSLVTTGQGDQRMGLTVSALSSLSTEPPSLLVCVNKSASAHQALLKNGVFTVNVLSADQQALASVFAQKGIDRFATANWQEGHTGSPVLPEAVMAFECTLENAVDGFSHSILIGVVKHIHQPTEPGAPLIWHQRSFAKLSQ